MGCFFSWTTFFLNSNSETHIGCMWPEVQVGLRRSSLYLPNCALWCPKVSQCAVWEALTSVFNFELVNIPEPRNSFLKLLCPYLSDCFISLIPTDVFYYFCERNFFKGLQYRRWRYLKMVFFILFKVSSLCSVRPQDAACCLLAWLCQCCRLC